MPPNYREFKRVSSFKNYDRQKSELITKDMKLSRWDASSFLKTWHHRVAMPRVGKVKTTLYQECCAGECDMDEITETCLNQECCEEGCRYEEVLEGCQAVKWDEIKHGML